MGKLTVEKCDIEGLIVLTPEVHGDNRGYFMETYQQKDFNAAAGIDVTFVQDNQSASTKGVLRGLHYQINHPQDKLVRVIKGEVFDVAVDLRKGSKTFGKWFGVLLSEENKKQFLKRKRKTKNLELCFDKDVLDKNEENYFMEEEDLEGDMGSDLDKSEISSSNELNEEFIFGKNYLGEKM